MARYAFSIDLDRCIGCQACVVACTTGNERPSGSHYIKVTESVRGEMPKLVGTFLHHRCFHCADAACVSVCPTGTLTKWNGLTTVTAEKCSGCGYCTDACPYKVPAVVEGRVAKCVACLDLVREGQTPWCAQTCPSQAIKFGERDKLLAEATARVATLKARYPDAQVYGETQFGGLGLLTVLPDKPQVFGLPEAARNPQPLGVWQSAIQPFSLGLSALSVVVTALLFAVARRQHLREHAALHAAQETGKEAEATPTVVQPVAQPAAQAVLRPAPEPAQQSAPQPAPQPVTPAASTTSAAAPKPVPKPAPPTPQPVTPAASTASAAAPKPVQDKPSNPAQPVEEKSKGGK